MKHASLGAAYPVLTVANYVALILRSVLVEVSFDQMNVIGATVGNLPTCRGGPSDHEGSVVDTDLVAAARRGRRLPTARRNTAADPGDTGRI